MLGPWINCRTVYLDKRSFPSRIDENFNNFVYTRKHRAHQHIPPPLENFPNVTKFVLDSMHLIFLGVFKCMMVFLKSGPSICKLDADKLEPLSERIKSLSKHIPSEFVRLGRDLTHLDRYKATEFHLLCLYTSVVALKDIVSDKLYKHYLLSFVALRILHDSRMAAENFRNQYLELCLLLFLDSNSKIISTF